MKLKVDSWCLHLLGVHGSVPARNTLRCFKARNTLSLLSVRPGVPLSATRPLVVRGRAQKKALKNKDRRFQGPMKVCSLYGARSTMSLSLSVVITTKLAFSTCEDGGWAD